MAPAISPAAYTIEQFGRHFAICRSTVYKLIDERKLAVRKIGKAVRIFVQDNPSWFTPISKAA